MKILKNLLVVTAVLEAPFGLALLLSPPSIAALLFGASLDAAAALAVGRLAGAAILALGVACWLARDDGQSRAARGLVAAMLLYDVAAMAVLVYAGIGLGLFSVLLWPITLLHATLAVWCIACLRSTPQNAGDGK